MLLVACSTKPEYSGSYSLTIGGTAIRFQLKSDGTFIGSPEDTPEGVNDDAVGKWKVEGDLLVCEGKITENPRQITVKFDKTNFKLISLAENGQEAPLKNMIPEGEDSIYLRKLQQSPPAPDAKHFKPVAEDKKTEPLRAKAPQHSISWYVKENNIEKVKQHLKAGTPVDTITDSDGHTPLICAMNGGYGHAFIEQTSIIKLLINSGANLNSSNRDGEMPLHLAAENNSVEIIKLLVSKGADINIMSIGENGEVGGLTPLDYTTNEDVRTFIVKNGGKSGVDVAKDNALKGIAPKMSLHMASLKGNIAAVKQHLAAGSNVNERSTEMNGLTPLHFAAKEGIKEIIKLLISAGADVNAKDNKWMVTPLHGVWWDEVAEILISKGADVNAADTDGKTPIDHAKMIGRNELVNLYKKHGGKRGEVSYSSIHEAAADGSLKAVKEYLNSGTEVDARNSDGQTALHIALIRKNFHPMKQIVDLLINAGADVNAKDNISSTPLDNSISDQQGEDNLQLVEMLIAKGADVNKHYSDGSAPINNAIFYNNNEVVEILIKAGANVNIKKDGGTTPLHQASSGYSDRTEIIELLIKNGARVNLKNDYDATPLDLAKIDATKKVLRKYNAKTALELINPNDALLHKSIQEGNIDAVRKSISAGADINSKIDGILPIIGASDGGYNNITKLLIEKGADLNAVNRNGKSISHKLAFGESDDEVELVKLLINKGANINLIDGDGFTPIMYARNPKIISILSENGGKSAEIVRAITTKLTSDGRKIPEILIHAMEGNLSAVKESLENGASPNAIPFSREEINEGRTPLFFAVQQGNEELIKLLIENGANVNAKYNGFTPLDGINALKNIETINLLSSYGGKSGAEDSLNVASFLGNLEAVEKHLKNGADLNVRNSFGGTPLHDAVWNGHYEIVKALIAKESNLNSKTNDGMSAMHLAILRNHKEITDLLIANEANINSINKEGKTPIDFARMRGDKEAVALLSKHGGKNGPGDFHKAALDGNLEGVQQHLSGGSNVNVKNQRGNTPLMEAVEGWRIKRIGRLTRRSRLSIVKVADTDIPDHMKILELLISNSANINIINKNGKTALTYAGSKGEAFDLLRNHGAKTGEELKAEGK